MLRNLIARLDALFYETTVTTTKVVTHRYMSDDTTATLAHLFAKGITQIRVDGVLHDIDTNGGITPCTVNLDRQEVDFAIGNHTAVIGDHSFNFKHIIKKRPALFIDDQPNVSSFPEYAYHDITVSFSDHDAYKAFYRGELLSRNRTIGKWSRKSIITTHSSILSRISTNPEAVVSKVSFSDMSLAVCMLDETLHLMVTTDDDVMIQINVDQIETTVANESAMTLAFALARATLLTMAQNGRTIDVDSEDSLAIAILTLIVTIRD